MISLPNKSYVKGYNFERRVMKHLEKSGFFVQRSGKSKFPDLIAVRKSDFAGVNMPDVLIVEVKVNKYISREEKSEADEIFEKTKIPLTVFWRDGRKLMRYEYKRDNIVDTP